MFSLRETSTCTSKSTISLSRLNIHRKICFESIDWFMKGNCSFWGIFYDLFNVFPELFDSSPKFQRGIFLLNSIGIPEPSWKCWQTSKVGIPYQFPKFSISERRHLKNVLKPLQHSFPIFFVEFPEKRFLSLTPCKKFTKIVWDSWENWHFTRFCFRFFPNFEWKKSLTKIFIVFLEKIYKINLFLLLLLNILSTLPFAMIKITVTLQEIDFS